MFTPSSQLLMVMVDSAMTRFDRHRAEVLGQAEAKAVAEQRRLFNEQVEERIRARRASTFTAADALANGCHPKPRDGGVMRFR